MKILELFAGTRSIGKAFEAAGHEVFSVEWDKNFDNINLYADIGTLTAEQILSEFGQPDVIWASPDCSTFSVAAISRHRRKNPETGSLDPISDYAKGLPRYTVTYCKYELDKPVSERRMKPTDIWTNHPDPGFIPHCKNGDPCHAKAPRGSQTGTQGMRTAKEKGVIPAALCEHIVKICEGEWRECDICHSMIQEGYCIHDGEEYFCSDDCLHGVYSEDEYEQLCESDCGYWTQWF